ncbi:hypothetical protein FA95DRAFT_647903 [Auriscalpium vulgare]|uniref:Uncharacterized protein n=1 Tax=Auriscalpium vulgare TaxID=40419 RepID=A0ACB8RE15_9AGAM|nr:hypothetical protein FA95DRAFT_647903 [Auriscalpium vulgare]
MSSPPSSPVSDDHPAIPVSHPRSSPRSPARVSPQPPISPPKAAAQNKAMNGNPSVATPTPNTPTNAAPLTPPDSVARSVPAADEKTAPPHAAVIAPAAPVHVEQARTRAPAPAQDEDPASLRTPNVYINGLPPNFPEEQLYAMTKDFGGVISVRTFTRHVSDRPSGYGFVLFDTVDSAAKCIESLRRYRNLHPSFSKQVHKIPGTEYASIAPSDFSSASSASSISDGHESFKARMERLKDESSTNLYIEGLPMSIDEPTLGALVAPYPIKSSRFFQTRLSHPPRIIAFVRLESRAACEEIIERLHGRMIRGWNDPGSRISVRFADSAEQRELRRTERTGQEDVSPPSRLTMAQAALLNLRGQHAQPHRGARAPDAGRRLPLSQSHTFADHQYTQANGNQNAYTHLPMHPIAADYQEKRTNVGNGRLPASRSAPSHLQGRGGPTPGQRELPPASASDIDLSLLSRTATASGFTPLEQQLIIQAQLRAEMDARQDALYEAQGTLAPSLMSATRHANGNGPRPLSRISLASAASSKEFVPRGLASRLQQAHAQADSYEAQTLSPIDFLPPMSEDEFHANAQLTSPQQQYSQRQQHMSNKNTPASHSGYGQDTNNNESTYKTIYDDENKERGIRLSNSMDFVFASNRQHATQATDQGNSALHMRSTTLPPQFMHGGSSGVGAGASNIGPSHARLNGILSPTIHSNVRTLGQNLSGKLNISVPTNPNATPVLHHDDSERNTLSPNSALVHTHHPADSPLVPSPALTYVSSSSASRTPSTLSPSTPFFPSFASAGEGFGMVGYKGEDHSHVAKERSVQAGPFGLQKVRTGSQ